MIQHLEILIDCLHFHSKMALVQIKDFNALIDNKPFFDLPVKNKQETYEKLISMTKKVKEHIGFHDFIIY